MPVPLILAEMANPEWVSVPLEGWSLSRALQHLTGAHIVTQVRNRDAFLRAGLVEGQDFTAINNEAVAAPVSKLAARLRGGSGKGWTTVMAMNRIAYPSFERKVWQTFEEELKAGRYALVHRVTPLSPTLPSPIARRLAGIGVPFVMGPMNGGVPWPVGFDAERRREREYLSYVRGAYRYLPGHRATLRNASAIIAGSRDTEAEYGHGVRDKMVYIPENAVDPERFAPAPRTSAQSPLRAAFVGRLVPYKGCDMLLRAAAPLLARGALHLDVLGDGPMRAELEALAADEGISSGVTFHGQVPHQEVHRALRAADLFVFPSVREFGGAVVIEAMALGVVPVVVGYGGPNEHVTDETGWRVPIGSRAEIEAAFRSTLEKIVADPSGLPGMARACVERVSDKYTWARKAEQVQRVYDWVLNPGSAKPDPFMQS